MDVVLTVSELCIRYIDPNLLGAGSVWSGSTRLRFHRLQFGRRFGVCEVKMWRYWWRISDITLRSHKAQYDPDWNHEQSVMIQRWSGQHTCTVTVAVHRWFTWTETSHFFCFDCSSFVVVIVALHRTVLTPRTCILPVVSHCYLSELMSVLNINMVLLKVVVLHHRILSFTDMIF